MTDRHPVTRSHTVAWRLQAELRKEQRKEQAFALFLLLYFFSYLLLPARLACDEEADVQRAPGKYLPTDSRQSMLGRRVHREQRSARRCNRQETVQHFLPQAFRHPDATCTVRLIQQVVLLLRRFCFDILTCLE